MVTNTENFIWIFGLVIIMVMIIFVALSSEWWQDRHYRWQHEGFFGWWFDWGPCISIGIILFGGSVDGWFLEALIGCSIVVFLSYLFYLIWKKKNHSMFD